MRLALAFLLALTALAPAAAGQASGVHVAWNGSGYAVAFTENGAPTVRWQSAQAQGMANPQQVSGPGEADRQWVATIPGYATRYQVDAESFDLAPRPAANGTLRVAFLADLGATEDSSRILDALSAKSPDLVILGGDLSYANGDAAKWDAWLARLQPLASRVPTMTALGNHETYCDDLLTPCAGEIREYVQRFPMPNAPNQYYAFSWGPATFIALDTEAYHHDVAMRPLETYPAPQLAFLNATLASAGNNWRIVFFHRPLYSSNSHDGGADPAARDSLVPALEAGGADLVLYGHAHAYERSWPLRADAPVAHASAWMRGTGTAYVDSGAAGESIYTGWYAQPQWSAVRSTDHEFLLLTISPDAIRGQAIGEDGRALDAFAIGRSAVPSLDAEAMKGVPGPGAALVAITLVGLVGLRRAMR